MTRREIDELLNWLDDYLTLFWFLCCITIFISTILIAIVL